MTVGVDLFVREIRWPGQFTQASVGGNLVYGFQTGNFSRMFINYSLEQTEVRDLNEIYTDPLVLARNPFLRDSLLIGTGTTSARSARLVRAGSTTRSISRSSRRAGPATRMSFDYAGIGGDTNFVNPRAEGDLVHPAQSPHVVRLPRGRRVHRAVRQHGRAADLRKAVSRRRIQHARIRPPHASGRAIR